MENGKVCLWILDQRSRLEEKWRMDEVTKSRGLIWRRRFIVTSPHPFPADVSPLPSAQCSGKIALQLIIYENKTWRHFTKIFDIWREIKTLDWWLADYRLEPFRTETHFLCRKMTKLIHSLMVKPCIFRVLITLIDFSNLLGRGKL